MNPRRVRGSVVILLWLGIAVAPQRSQGFADQPSQPGNLPEQDFEKLRKAPDGGEAEAQFLVGKAYWYGTGVEADRGTAVEYYRKAAEKNHANALAGLGAAYGLGQGVEKRDETLAADYFRRAAELGSAVGQMNLGMMLIAGKTVPKDAKEGVEWIRNAADQGLLKAELYLGEMYLAGDSAVSRDYAEARKWVRKAADQEDGRALNLYGVILRDGLGGERDPAGAVPHFRRAADQGFVKGFLNLGSAYFFGNGVEMDKLTGMSWWFAGEELGDGAAGKPLQSWSVGLSRRKWRRHGNSATRWRVRSSLPC